MEEVEPKKLSSRTVNEAVDRSDWNVVGQFGSMMYWNWDKIPSDGDGICQLLQWTRLAKVVHFPLGYYPSLAY